MMRSCSSFVSLNIQVSIDRFSFGGGEGIRTPDPRVANAVLCQLSYAPDKQSEIPNSKFKIPEIGCGGGI
jgi:hypothetical protein